MITADSTLRLADLAVERGCYLPLLPKQRLAADKAQREMDDWNPTMTKCLFYDINKSVRAFGRIRED